MKRACSCGSSEQAGELGREVDRAGLGDAAHRHAGVLGLEHHGDAARLEDLLDRGRDLRGQVLLRLQAPRIDVDQPRDLGQAHHALGRHIGDVRLAGERHHVVLAVRIERDVAHQHEIVVAAGLRERAVEHLGRAFLVAAEQLLIGAHEPLRRLDQALAVRIVADIGEQGAHRLFGLLARRARDGRHGRGAHVIRQRAFRAQAR